jgi:hypothetical protein
VLEAHKTINLEVDLEVDRRIILKSKLKEWGVKTWTGFIKLRIWPMGGPNKKGEPYTSGFNF